jgi:hypothetical protein
MFAATRSRKPLVNQNRGNREGDETDTIYHHHHLKTAILVVKLLMVNIVKVSTWRGRSASMHYILSATSLWQRNNYFEVDY